MVGSETRPVRKGRLRFVRLGQRGVRTPEVDQRVSEAQDGPRVVRSDLEDGAKQKDGLVRMAVSPELFRLLHDLSRFRRLETKRIAQRVDRDREPAKPKEEIRTLV